MTVMMLPLHRLDSQQSVATLMPCVEEGKERDCQAQTRQGQGWLYDSGNRLLLSLGFEDFSVLKN